MGEVEERGAEDDQEHRREDEDHGREEHLDRRLHRLLLGGGLAAQARVGGLHAQDPAERDAELVGLDHRAHEGGDLRRRHALGQLLQRVVARLADADLAERERELVDERALHVLGQLRERAVEAEAGLDRDREQVERVRQLRADGLAARAHSHRHEGVREEEAEDPRERREQDARERRCRTPNRTLTKKPAAREPGS